MHSIGTNCSAPINSISHASTGRNQTLDPHLVEMPYRPTVIGGMSTCG